MVGVAIMILFEWWLTGNISRVAHAWDARNPHASDFAILVKGLPESASDEELQNHFKSQACLQATKYFNPEHDEIELVEAQTFVMHDVRDSYFAAEVTVSE